jgi:hypothetical protein
MPCGDTAERAIADELSFPSSFLPGPRELHPRQRHVPREELFYASNQPTARGTAVHSSYLGWTRLWRPKPPWLRQTLVNGAPFWSWLVLVAAEAAAVHGIVVAAIETATAASAAGAAPTWPVEWDSSKSALVGFVGGALFKTWLEAGLPLGAPHRARSALLQCGARRRHGLPSQRLDAGGAFGLRGCSTRRSAERWFTPGSPALGARLRGCAAAACGAWPQDGPPSARLRRACAATGAGALLDSRFRPRARSSRAERT